MAQHVSDLGSNFNENLEHWGEILGTSKARNKVFQAVYSGKKKKWTADELIDKTHLGRVSVLHEGKRLAASGLLHEEKIKGRVIYSKDDRVQQHKKKIVRFAHSKSARESLPTKRRPSIGNASITIRISRQRGKARQITIDDVDSFTRAHKVKSTGWISSMISESMFRDGVKAILGELGHFADWPGEQHDIYSSKLRIGQKRYASAFAFKGPGMRGILTPGKCGKNGDQIQRLFESPAQVYFFQYHGQIAPSVIKQMEVHARLHSMHTYKEVMFGVIDGQDSQRLVLAYPSKFKAK